MHSFAFILSIIGEICKFGHIHLTHSVNSAFGLLYFGIIFTAQGLYCCRNERENELW